MCDTQVLRAENGIWFAKNSDREPQEPQAVVAVPAVRADPARELRTTYLTIEQQPQRAAMILCKPSWIWGAEMGFNEHGLVIGNEAIFSRQRSKTPALLGMDLLRLGLERAQDCASAIEVITGLLRQHGQGGPAGYADKGFHYDSSFILADPKDTWVLETVGREWVARRVDRFAAISNALSLERADLRSEQAAEAWRRQDSWMLPHFGRSRERRALSLQCLATTARSQADFAAFASHLRTHATETEDPLQGSNADICMHAAGPIRRSQTTGSLVVWLGAQGIRAMATGTSAPCLSMFRPLQFGAESSLLAPSADRAPLWSAWEPVQRAALFDHAFRMRLRARIAAEEARWLPAWMEAGADAQDLDAPLQAAVQEILQWPRPELPRKLWGAPRIWRQPIPV